MAILLESYYLGSLLVSCIVGCIVACNCLDTALGHFVEKRRPIANKFIDGGRKIIAEQTPSASDPYCTKKKPIYADDSYI